MANVRGNNLSLGDQISALGAIGTPDTKARFWLAIAEGELTGDIVAIGGVHQGTPLIAGIDRDAATRHITFEQPPWATRFFMSANETVFARVDGELAELVRR
jgi:hypothetical protein